MRTPEKPHKSYQSNLSGARVRPFRRKFCLRWTTGDSSRRSWHDPTTAGDGGANSPPTLEKNILTWYGRIELSLRNFVSQVTLLSSRKSAFGIQDRPGVLPHRTVSHRVFPRHGLDQISPGPKRLGTLPPHKHQVLLLLDGRFIQDSTSLGLVLWWRPDFDSRI